MEKVVLAKAGNNEVMGEVIKRFTPFIIKTARGIYVKGYELEDLIQIGQVSIIKAVNMFDVDKSSGFISYVTNTITRSLYYLIRSSVKAASCCSLNSVNDEGYELIESIVSEENLEEQIIQDEEKAALNKALEKLPLKHKEIIYWFYFENKTLEQYAKEKGIAYRTAVDRKKKALEKLRGMLKEDII
ncbi:sigma-70 family RNA polymerase sigma factor [Clostridium sp. DJ247]|uniref:sigma-70 family RNA polymerase sigma factor n=1 Tax=Clostridium sp. DJ247 TaxID=2726188 RepID=UPI001629CD73|nr:sigma-70 family RNA polymerase sigma factor [Clostridium sp. DJ247]MBC2579078.1 sigma-70 family RNA polymerase sigma factor [Clostridium sp. DJ247]